jgi:DNA polymerase-4
LSELTNHAVQGSLFDDAEKKNNLYKAIDDVKLKFGKGLLQKARTVRPSED